MSDLGERILECALDLYVKHGVKGISMRQVGERLGVSATAIYRHYRNKEDLVHRIIGEAIKVFGGYLFTALSAKTAGDRYHMSGEAYLNFALEKSQYYEVIFMAPSLWGESEFPGELRERSMATFQFLVDRVQECMETGLFRREDAHAVAMTVWAHGHGLISIHLAGKSRMDEAAFRRFYWESHERLQHGLRHAGPATRGSQS